MTTQINIEPKLLSAKMVAMMLNRSYSHFMQHIKTQSTFPKPIKATPRGHAQWNKKAIEAWIAGE